MFKEFKSQEADPLDRTQISQLFHKGDLQAGVKQCNKAHLSIAEFQSEIDAGIHKLILSHRASEALSFIHKYKFQTKHDIRELLLSVFNNSDYHGFLKNVHRLEVYEGLEEKISHAIKVLHEKGQHHDADGWQRKIQELKVKKS